MVNKYTSKTIKKEVKPSPTTLYEVGFQLREDAKKLDRHLYAFYSKYKDAIRFSKDSFYKMSRSLQTIDVLSRISYTRRVIIYSQSGALAKEFNALLDDIMLKPQFVVLGDDRINANTNYVISITPGNNMAIQKISIPTLDITDYCGIDEEVLTLELFIKEYMYICSSDLYIKNLKGQSHANLGPMHKYPLITKVILGI